MIVSKIEYFWDTGKISYFSVQKMSSFSCTKKINEGDFFD